ncbi:MAG: hypothetical protein LUC93_00670 [Planctomycetaceae bacterium]|nr:hypothetical protein [Planctomycetaceae bacterium]
MKTGNLFAVIEEPRAPPAPRPPPPPKYRVPLERHDLKKPYGKPDAKGGFFWQKAHKELEKLSEEEREFVNYITINRHPDGVLAMAKVMRLIGSAGNMDLVDFDESRGRL